MRAHNPITPLPNSLYQNTKGAQLSSTETSLMSLPTTDTRRGLISSSTPETTARTLRTARTSSLQTAHITTSTSPATIFQTASAPARTCTSSPRSSTSTAPSNYFTWNQSLHRRDSFHSARFRQCRPAQLTWPPTLSAINSPCRSSRYRVSSVTMVRSAERLGGLRRMTTRLLWVRSRKLVT